MNRLLSLLVSLAMAAPAAFGMSISFPKIGTPIVSETSIVFTEPASEPHRIISVNRESGQKNWEITDPEKTMAVWLAPSEAFQNRYIISKGSDIFFCDPSSGKTTLAFQTGLARCMLESLSGSRVCVTGEKDDSYYLQVVDLQRGDKLWEVPEVGWIRSTGNGLIFCERAGIKVNKQDKSYQYVNSRLTAIAEKDGSIQWEHHLAKGAFGLSACFPVGKYLVATHDRAIHCYESASGRLLKSLRIREDAWDAPTLVKSDDAVLAWDIKGRGAFRGGVVYEISVPDLEKRLAGETEGNAVTAQLFGDVLIGGTSGGIGAYNLKTKQKLWEGGQWNWTGVHDGHIYYSVYAEKDENEQHALLKKIEVKTGETKLLYREEIAEKARLKLR